MSKHPKIEHEYHAGKDELKIWVRGYGWRIKCHACLDPRIVSLWEFSSVRMLPKPVRARPPATCRHPSIRRPLPTKQLRKPKIRSASTRRKRRDVQRRLTGLGFDTKVNGKFDESTRAVITRWQGARGYPKTGFLNTLQHQALLTEVRLSGARQLQQQRQIR